MVFIYNTIPHTVKQEQINSSHEKEGISCTRHLKELTAPNKKFLISLGFKLIKKKFRRRHIRRK